ncbi:BrnA antitoxin family protein [Cupriavidus pinatubonensis]|uniref:BrnA antitoxin family protein n=1 Tax=Cupriavidus pinatubonensis TaxID=248026 RepID=UPI003613B64B
MKTRSGRTLIVPSAEDAAINHGIDADPDTYEVSAEDIEAMTPLKNRGGRPKLANPKEPVTIRYDVEVLAAFRASGDGWQTRMNDALKNWLRTHRP